jgi:hypothetical protein
MGVVSRSASPAGRAGVVDVLVVDRAEKNAAVHDAANDAAVHDATQATLNALATTANPRRVSAAARELEKPPARHTLFTSLAVVLVFAALLALGFQNAAAERRSAAKLDALEQLIRDGRRKRAASGMPRVNHRAARQ